MSAPLRRGRWSWRHLREVAELAGDPAQHIDLFHQVVAEAVEAFPRARCGRVPGLLEVLDGQLHRGEGILDLVRHLPGHLLPCTFPLALCQPIRAFPQLLHFAVIHLHQLAHFIAPSVTQLAVRAFQLNTGERAFQEVERSSCPVADEERHQHTEGEEEDEEVDHGDQHTGSLLFLLSLVRERGQR